MTSTHVICFDQTQNYKPLQILQLEVVSQNVLQIV